MAPGQALTRVAGVVVLYVWIGVAVLAVVFLGGLVFAVLGAVRRLGREMAALDAEVRPVLEHAQRSSARAAESRGRNDAGPANGG